MKQSQKQNPMRRIASHFLALFALFKLIDDAGLAYWDHSITGKLGSRSQWGFDVHKYHIKNHKYARRR